MSKRYSIAEARISLAAIVDTAEAGEKVELTRRGRPVVVVISLREFERLGLGKRRFATAYRTFLATHRLADIGLDADLAPARDKGPGRKVSL